MASRYKNRRPAPLWLTALGLTALGIAGIAVAVMAFAKGS